MTHTNTHAGVVTHALVALSIAVVSAPAAAQVIDFETTPAGLLPSDNAALDRTAVYTQDGVGVTFGFDTNGDGLTDQNAVFERRGVDSGTGFVSTNGSLGNDSEAPNAGSALGEFFLRQANSLGNVPGVFVISYDTEVQSLSGEIWDIDGRDDGAFEQWRVSAFNAAGDLITSLLSPQGIEPSEAGSLDSREWTFVFDLPDGIPGITRVELEYVGTAGDVGLAFDNYNATAIPAPAGALAAIGLGIAAARRRR